MELDDFIKYAKEKFSCEVSVTRKMNTSQLRNIIKLLVDRMTPTNVKINRIQNS